jgi:aldose 1-epimerase
MVHLIFFLMASLLCPTANFTARRVTVEGNEVIRLTDTARNMEVSVLPSLGNNAYELKINGKNIFWSPYSSLRELMERPAQAGNPLLAPWANRIDGDAYWANGKRYLLNPALNNFRYDANHKPIHGLLAYAREWKVVGFEANDTSASVTSRLEFWRNPDWMAQFPFAHTITMTYRLAQGALEVETAIENLSSEPMPLSLGYHTYYRLHDSARDDWRVHVAARERLVASDLLIPTGEKQPVEMSDARALRDYKLDDGFSDLIRDPDGRAEFWVRGINQKISVRFGRKYDIAIVYAPAGRDFICFEPMAGLTNAFNLAHEGVYRDLQSIPPGRTWIESFWIIPEGF